MYNIHVHYYRNVLGVRCNNTFTLTFMGTLLRINISAQHLINIRLWQYLLDRLHIPVNTHCQVSTSLYIVALCEFISISVLDYVTQY